MKKIYCLDDLANAIIDMMVKYSGYKPSEINRHDIIGEFVNYADYLCYLEEIPCNDETFYIFEYVFLNYVAHDDVERKYMKMVLDKSVSLAEMLSEAHKEFSNEYETGELDQFKPNNKFHLYNFIIEGEEEDNPDRWCGIEEYFEKPSALPSDEELRKLYEQYKLQWLIDHGYTLNDIINQLQELYDNPYFDEDNDSNLISNLFDMWEDEFGFPGAEIWACYDEWLKNDCEDQ